VEFRFIAIQTVELYPQNFVENAYYCVAYRLHTAVMMRSSLFLLDTRLGRLVCRYL